MQAQDLLRSLTFSMGCVLLKKTRHQHWADDFTESSDFRAQLHSTDPERANRHLANTLQKSQWNCRFWTAKQAASKDYFIPEIQPAQTQNTCNLSLSKVPRSKWESLGHTREIPDCFSWSLEIVLQGNNQNNIQNHNDDSFSPPPGIQLFQKLE